MDILNTPTTLATTTGATTTQQAETATALASDFDTFLQMLTAQARYQDPLEPIDSSEYAAQLAQFSMVEQQVLSNDLLTDLTNQISANSIGEAAGWIGLEARTTAPVAFEGDPITILPTTLAGATDASLVVYNENGTEIQREQIATGDVPFEWLGLSSSGGPLPNGVYGFKVESRTVDEVLGMTEAETYARVTEARRDGDTAIFVLNGGSLVTADGIAALRSPS